MSTKAIVLAFAVLSLHSPAVDPAGTPSLRAFQFVKIPGVSSQQERTTQPQSTSRMDDKGCCVLKKSKYKPEWDYSDDETRRLCIETAHKTGVDYDFYKDQKCDNIRK